MAIVLKPLSDQVIVITGASSGIGLVTARQAAARGAKVVLASRNEEALVKIVDDIKAKGGDAIHVVADVGHKDEVENIAYQAEAQFGRIDTWVNNAGVSIWGYLREVSEEDHKRLFDTNFWGVVHGSIIAAKHLRKNGGAIINLGSVASDIAFPVQGMYCASKHAIKGFTDALRMELEDEGAPVSVTLIKPTGINTPFVLHARNYMEYEPKLPAPAYAPEEVAYAILHAAEHSIRDIYIGGSGKAMTSFAALAPRIMDWLGAKAGVSMQLRKGQKPRHPDGSLHQMGVDGDGHVHGDQPGLVLKRSYYTRASVQPFAGVALATLVALAGAALMGTRKTRGRRRFF